MTVLMMKMMRMLMVMRMLMMLMMSQWVESAAERPRMRMVMGRTQSPVQPARLRGPTPVMLMLLLMIIVVMMMMMLMMMMRLTMLMMMMTTPPCLPLTSHHVVHDLGRPNFQPAELMRGWSGEGLMMMMMMMMMTMLTMMMVMIMMMMMMMMMMMVMMIRRSTVCGARVQGDACTGRPVTRPESTSAPSSNHMLSEPIV
jgi:hypothetical protein